MTGDAHEAIRETRLMRRLFVLAVFAALVVTGFVVSV